MTAADFSGAVQAFAIAFADGALVIVAALTDPVPVQRELCAQRAEHPSAEEAAHVAQY